MSLLIIIFFVGAALSLVYETCIVPAVRTEFQYELFALRDELRRARIEGTIIDDQCYAILSENLNNAITAVHTVDGMLLSETWYALRHDKCLNEFVSKRVELLNNCGDEVIQRIKREIRLITMKSFFIGSGGLFAHILPIFLVFGFWAGIKDLLRRFLSLPEAVMSQQLNHCGA